VVRLTEAKPRVGLNPEIAFRCTDRKGLAPDGYRLFMLSEKKECGCRVRPDQSEASAIS
jgi:hypothetical protein